MTLAATLRWLCHLQPQQIGWRLADRARRPFLVASEGQPIEPTCFPTDPWPGEAENGRRIAVGTIRLLDRDQPFTPPIDWAPAARSPLERFTLNYFEWLADLKAADEAAQARQRVADWIAAERDPGRESWHPYPLSLRLFSWLRFAPFLLGGADAAFRALFLSALDRQARLLPNRIERDVGGNHMIKNLKTLLALALCFADRRGEVDRWLAALGRQVALQILPDGFHYERSPDYHLQVLIDLIDCADLLAQQGRHVAWLEDAIARMILALAGLRHGDGGLALFNDGTVGDSKRLEALDRRFGRVKAPAMLPDAGYARLESGDRLVIFDAGRLCPDSLTAHAHADTLSFEMSVGRERLIVNSGTYAYQEPLWRSRLRGTAAHSTATVGGRNSAEVFGAFRLGRRPRQVTLGREADWAIGRHDGYRHLGVTHERRLRLTQDGLEGCDCFTGNGPAAVLRFHLHPSVAAWPARDRHSVSLVGPAGVWCFEAPQHKVAIAPGVYSPRFHVLQETLTLEIKTTLDAEALVPWRIVQGGTAAGAKG
ncbi:MAG: heparinase II/III family protein [Rhodospirillales bacterium]|nr:heparinase II/III family protein [Rhodospirillales bacterium]